MPHAQQHSNGIQAVTIQRPLVMTESSMPLGSQTTGPPALGSIAALSLGYLHGYGQPPPSSSPKQPADGAVSPVFQPEVLNWQ